MERYIFRARRKQPVDDQMDVKVTPEAYNALVEI